MLFLGATNSSAFDNCSPSGALIGVYTCSGTMNTYSTTTVESGINAISISGQSISLKPGFWAKAGSTFTATINTSVNVDSDNDGMLDVWESIYFGNLNQSANGDFDNDGASNYSEYFYHTDPTNPNSKPTSGTKGSTFTYDELGRIKTINRVK
jgi:hypothetical protein